MSVVTTRPNEVIAAGTVEVFAPTGIGLATALSDDLDTTYAIFTSADHPYVGFAEPSVPAGAVVKAGRLRVRARKVSTSAGSMRPNYRMFDPEGASPESANVYGFNKDAVPPPSSWTTFVALNDERTAAHVTPTDVVADISTYSPHDAAGPMHVAALYFDTVYVIKPVVQVEAPTGTLTGDTTPLVSWTNTLDTDGGGQTHFQAKLSTSATPTAAAIEDSGETASGLTSWQGTTAISDGTRYAHVKVAQTVNGVLHWSDWDTQSFTVSIARPGVPTMTLTAQSANARIQVGLDDNAGAATTDLFQTQVSDDGTTWEDLRTALGDGLSTPAAGLATEHDYEAPNGATRSFRTRALHSYAEGYAVGAWSATGTSSWTSTEWQVKNLVTPALNVAVLVRSQPSTTRTGRVGLFQPLDAKYPIAVLDKRSSASGQIAFRFQTDAARDAFEALVDESSVVFIQAPAGTYDWPDRYCALGDYERERAIDTGGNAYTFDTVTWTEVARP